MDTQQEFSKSEKFWMNFKLYQLWRFIVLNIIVAVLVGEVQHRISSTRISNQERVADCVGERNGNDSQTGPCAGAFAPAQQ